MSGEEAGSSVCLSADGTRMVVGSPGGDIDINLDDNAGRVRIYELVNGTWNSKRITGEEGEGIGHFVSMSADGDRIAIGGYGKTRIYENVNGNWVQLKSDIGQRLWGLGLYLWTALG